MPLLRSERLERITRMLNSGQGVSVAALGAHFGVSEMTVRRDLKQLDALGYARRVHGGAVATTDLVRTQFQIRTAEHAAEKARIGRAVAELIPEGSSVILDIGTTVFYVARELRQRSGLFLATNSLAAAYELVGSANRVLVLGGMIYGGEQEPSLVGQPTIELIRRLRVDTLVLGAGGVSLNRELLYFSFEEVEVRRAMLEVAKTVVLVVDRSKFDHNDLPVALPMLSRVDVVVTDAPPPAPFERHLQKLGVKVLVTGEPERCERQLVEPLTH